MKVRAITLALCLCTAGCGTRDGEPPASNEEPAQAPGQATVAVTPPPPDPISGPTGGHDLSQIKSKLEGAWVVGGSTIGTKEAWDIKGNQVTIFDGKADKILELAILSPCSLKVTEKSAGGSSSTVKTFVFDGDTLYMGLGSAGLVRGDTVLGCMNGGVYVLDGGVCKKWKESMWGDGKWDSQDVTCERKKDGDADVFAAEGSELRPHGGVLMTRQMQGNQAEKLADFAAAKARLGG